MTNNDWNEIDSIDTSDTDWAEQEYVLGQDEDRANGELEDDEYVDARAAHAIKMLADINRWQPRQTTESIRAYGERIVRYVQETQLTGPLTDEDLELAQHTIIGLYPAASPTVVSALRSIEGLISLILRCRRQEQASTALAAPAVEPHRPAEGPMAPLPPAPIARPPAPTKIAIEF